MGPIQSVEQDKTWPKPGDVLVHKFRRRTGQVTAEVINVDRKTGRISVKVNGEIYRSLSASAKSITGSATNGWIYWGLKSQAKPGTSSNKE